MSREDLEIYPPSSLMTMPVSWHNHQSGSALRNSFYDLKFVQPSLSAYNSPQSNKIQFRDNRYFREAPLRRSFNTSDWNSCAQAKSVDLFQGPAQCSSISKSTDDSKGQRKNRALSHSAGSSRKLLLEINYNNDVTEFDFLFKVHLQQCVNHMEINQKISASPDAPQVRSTLMRCLVFYDASMPKQNPHQSIADRWRDTLNSLIGEWIIDEITYSNAESTACCNIRMCSLPSAVAISPDSKQIQHFGSVDGCSLLSFLRKAEENYYCNADGQLRTIRWFDENLSLHAEKEIQTKICDARALKADVRIFVHEEYPNVMECSKSVSSELELLRISNAQSQRMIARTEAILENTDVIMCRIQTLQRMTCLSPSKNLNPTNLFMQEESQTIQLQADTTNFVGAKSIPGNSSAQSLYVDDSSQSSISAKKPYAQTEGVENHLQRRPKDLKHPSFIPTIRDIAKVKTHSMDSLLSRYLINIYRLVDPRKLNDVPHILERYTDREEALIYGLFQMFGLDTCDSIFSQTKLDRQPSCDLETDNEIYKKFDIIHLRLTSGEKASREKATDSSRKKDENDKQIGFNDLLPKPVRIQLTCYHENKSRSLREQICLC